jgi:hypothetical protein
MATKKKGKKTKSSKPTSGKKSRAKKRPLKKAARKKVTPKKRTATKKNTTSSRKASSTTGSSRQKVNRRSSTRRNAKFELETGSGSAGQSGDLQGLRDSPEGADSESVSELLEEGNAFEAGVVAGVEHVEDDEEREVHTHEVPEDDVPEEYLDKD